MLALLVSCDLSGLFPEKNEEPEEEKNDYNYDEPEKNLERIAPGIYERVYTDNPVDDYMKNETLVLGTDGSILYIEDRTMSGGRFILPIRFSAFDGKDTEYAFTSALVEGVPYHAKTVHIASDGKSPTEYADVEDKVSVLREWANKFELFWDYPTWYKKVADAGTLEENYSKLCRMYGGDYEYPAIKDRFTEGYKIDLPGTWPKGYYPEEMNEKRWVLPYSGKGAIETFKVFRDYGWTDRPNWYWCWTGSLHMNDVTHIYATISGLTLEEAIAYKNSIKNMTDRYNNLVYDDLEAGEIAFLAGTSDTNISAEDYPGYYYPTFKVTYELDSGFNYLTVRFSVERTVFV